MPFGQWRDVRNKQALITTIEIDVSLIWFRLPQAESVASLVTVDAQPPAGKRFNFGEPNGTAMVLNLATSGEITNAP